MEIYIGFGIVFIIALIVGIRKRRTNFKKILTLYKLGVEEGVGGNFKGAREFFDKALDVQYDRPSQQCILLCDDAINNRISSETAAYMFKSIKAFDAVKSRDDKEGTDRVIQLVKQAIEACPTYARAHCDLGGYYGLCGKTESAIQEFREAVRLDPHYAEAYYNLGIALHGIDGKESKECLDKAKKLGFR